MRWLLFLIIVFAVLWFIRGIEEVEPPPIEEGIIGGPVRALRKAESFQPSLVLFAATGTHCWLACH